MTDHSTWTGLKWGIVGGGVASELLPVTIVAGAVALGVAGAVAGKARNLAHRLEVEKELAASSPRARPRSWSSCPPMTSRPSRPKMPGTEEVKAASVDDETAATSRKPCSAARA